MNQSKFQYQSNQKLLSELIGKKIVESIQNQHFFEGNMNKESMGALKLGLANGKFYTFDCHEDAESLCVQEGDFSNLSHFEAEFTEHKWIQAEFLSKQELGELGTIKSVQLEWVYGNIQSGCKINFENEQFLYIWTTESDNIFYGLNVKPPYHKKNFDIRLEEITT